jgi:tRNA (cytidine/uridine-2'-O-)-methyltransferase
MTKERYHQTTEHPFRLEVVLHEPEIPQNTGSIARTCAALGCPLHLIEPLGFSLDHKYIKRAGMDYWKLVDVKRYPDLETFFKINNEGRYCYFSKKTTRFYSEADYRGRIYIFFGKESLGLPESLLAQNQDNSFRLPMINGIRSLNLSNAVSIVMYEAFRQNNFPNLS